VTETATPPAITPAETGYAPVNGLQMYYEVFNPGAGETPVLLLHGSFMMQSSDFGAFLTGLAASRTVIVPTLQAHGRTGDIDRPITYQHLADDCAALLSHLGVARADVVGFSLGGATATQLAIRHPEVVRSLVPMSSGYRYDGTQPELVAMLPNMSAEMFAGSPFEAAYNELAPNPADFPTLVEKIKVLNQDEFTWDEEIKTIAAPTMIVLGDSDDAKLEHAVAMYRLMGGGAMGDMAGISKVRLLILPATTHFIPFGIGMLDRHEWLLPIISSFHAAPDPIPAPTF
jgi:pimeloyl-ACP methyl ester carboxylesterase